MADEGQQEVNWELLAKAVKDRRLAMKLTQGQLARRASVGASTIRNIEQHARDSYSDSTLEAVEHAVLAPVGWARAVLTNTGAGKYYSIRVTDATVSNIMRQITPAAGNIDEDTSFSDTAMFNEVLRRVGATTPPDPDGASTGARVTGDVDDAAQRLQAMRDGGTAAMTGESSLTVGGHPTYAKLRALRPLFDAYGELSAITEPTDEERHAISVVWNLIDRLRREAEGRSLEPQDAIEIVRNPEGKIEVVDLRHGTTLGFYGSKEEAVQGLMFTPWIHD